MLRLEDGGVVVLTESAALLIGQRSKWHHQGTYKQTERG